MELSHRVVMVLSAKVQRQTNKTVSETFSSCLKLKSLPSLFIKFITTNRLDPGQISIQKLNEASEMVTITKQRRLIFLVETNRRLTSSKVRLSGLRPGRNTCRIARERVSACKTTRLYFPGCTRTIFYRGCYCGDL